MTAPIMRAREEKMPARREAPQRFIADCMLGRLAKWLRVIGYDAAYERSITDEAILVRAWREKRVLLTRDTGLVRRRALKRNGVEWVLVRSDRPEDQLEQVVRDRRLRVGPRRLLSRCLICNVRTARADRDDVAARVPPYVLETQRRFSRCPRCDRIYWRATHVDRMMDRLADAVGSQRG